MRVSALAGILVGFGLGVPSFAHAVDYHCVPLEVAVREQLVHVECAPPAPLTRGGFPKDTGHEIRFFAVSLSDNPAWIERFIQTANIAITSGRPMRLSFDSGDYDGEAFGCLRQDCRTVRAFAILRTAIVPVP
jgi:hypothetical protein